MSLIPSMLHQSWCSISGVLQSKKPVKLMFKIYGKFMRGLVLLGQIGTQVGNEFTVILILNQLLLVFLLSVGRCSVICCLEDGKNNILFNKTIKYWKLCTCWVYFKRTNKDLTFGKARVTASSPLKNESLKINITFKM